MPTFAPRGAVDTPSAWCAAAAALFGVWTLQALAQQPMITGRVIDSQLGDAIVNARVSIVVADSPERPAVLTDTNGRFAVPVSVRSYRIVATKTGYGRAEVASPSPETPLEIRLRRAVAMAGRVVDDFGEPVPAARVAAEGDTGAVAGTSVTDDRGEYRLGGLVPGSYVVRVTTTGLPVRSGDGFGRVVLRTATYQAYYPDAGNAAAAQRLPLGAGEERGGIDFVVPADRSGNHALGVARGISIMVAPPPAPAARGPRRTATIGGRVVTVGGRALPYALVSLERGRGFIGAPIVRTGLDGRFSFSGAEPGAVRVAASKNGYLMSARSVDLREGETRDDVEVTLAPWGTISGRVLDELGEPVQGARVEPLQLRYQSGRRRLAPAAAVSDVTDDQGSFRLYGLSPGQYVVSAEVGGVAAADLPGYALSYFPGTAMAAGAQYLAVTRSEPDAVGIDFSLARIRTFRIAGRFLNAAGDAGGGSLELVPSHWSSAAVSRRMGARLQADGAFEFPNVPPGEYVIQANRGRLNPWTEGEFGALRVTVVDSDVVGLTLRTSRGSSIRGRVVFENHAGTSEPSASMIQLTPVPVDPDLSPPNNHATPGYDAEGRFVLEGINGPRRLQVTGAPDGWALREIRVNGIERTDEPLAFGTADQSLRDVEVVMTDRISTIAGTVADDRARLVPATPVLAFSLDRTRWYDRSRHLRRTETNDMGRFEATGMPGGSYYVVALDALPDGGADAWQDPVYLESLIPRATIVALGEGQRASVSLRAR